MDIFDQAQDKAEQFRQQALREHRKQVAGTPTGPGAETCIECGDEISAARRQALPGCVLCIDCQQEFENSNRRNG